MLIPGWIVRSGVLFVIPLVALVFFTLETKPLAGTYDRECKTSDWVTVMARRNEPMFISVSRLACGEDVIGGDSVSKALQNNPNSTIGYLRVLSAGGSIMCRGHYSQVSVWIGVRFRTGTPYVIDSCKPTAA